MSTTALSGLCSGSSCRPTEPIGSLRRQSRGDHINRLCELKHPWLVLASETGFHRGVGGSPVLPMAARDDPILTVRPTLLGRLSGTNTWASSNGAIT